MIPTYRQPHCRPQAPSVVNTRLEFLNLNELPDDVVENIKNFLNKPCPAVELPEAANEAFYRPTVCENVEYDDGADVGEVLDHVKYEAAQRCDTLGYGAAPVSVVGTFPAHMAQAPALYPIVTSANGNYLTSPSAIQHVVFVPKMVNGLVEGVEVSSMEAISQSGGAMLDTMSLASSSTPAAPPGVVVSSSPYHHYGVFHCPAPPPHRHFVMSPLHPSAYISPYMQPPPVTMCEPTASVPCTVPSFITPHVSIPGPMAIPLVSPPLLSEAMPPSPDVSVDNDDGTLETVVVEVPTTDVPSVGAVLGVGFVADAGFDPLLGPPGPNDLCFLCPDELGYLPEGTDEVVFLPEGTGDAAGEDPEPVAEASGGSASDVDWAEEEYDKSAVSEPEILASVCEGDDGTVPAATVDSPPPPARPCAWEQPVAEKPSVLNKSFASLFRTGGAGQAMTPAAAAATSRVVTPAVPSSRTASNVVRDPGGVGGPGAKSVLPKTPRADSVAETKEGAIMSPLAEGGVPVVVEDLGSLLKLGRFLSDVELDYQHTKFHPHGLTNRGNWCYINSMLQVLVACTPLYNLLMRLPSASARGPDKKSCTPILDSLIEFVREYTSKHKPAVVSNAGPRNRDNGHGVQIGQPFEPSNIYAMLSHLKLNAFEGRQEDAEEFLSCLLNGVHDEMVRAMSAVRHEVNGVNSVNTNGNADDNDSGDDGCWQVMEARNKCSVMRTTTFFRTPLSDIFCGRIRSAVHSSSSSSATLQQFFTLPLDIQPENVRCVKDALLGFATKECLEDYHCAKTKQEVSASRQITLEEVPPVLVLHLKRFVYCKDGGCKKLSKRVDFAVDLDLQKDLISPAMRGKISSRQRNYRLAAVVYHCGVDATKGHYVTDAFFRGSDLWLRFDDSRVLPVSEAKVLKHPANLVPYLLFYRRLDTDQ